jgi:hypothetical protein
VIQTDYQSTFGNLPRNHLEFLQRNLLRESEARQRLRSRDESDWPILAAALGLACAVWTEDADLFGTGVTVWTTNRIENFFEGTSTVN